MPTQKIYDIIPPKITKTTIKTEKKIEEEKRKEEKEITKKYIFEQKNPVHFSPFKTSILILVLIILFGGGIVCFKYSWAEVEIWPNFDEFNFKKQIEINQNVKNVDVNNFLLPGKISEIEKEISQDFSSSGRAIKKAEGVIRVFNNYTKDQVLIKNTRFISTDGKLFYSKNKIIVPAGKYTDVGVIAAKEGEEYNIGPSVFSIPGLSGLPQYYSITGKSSSPMAGGGEVKVVSQEDLDNAKNVLIDKLVEEAKSSLNKDFILLNEAISKEIGEISGPKVGTELESFNLKLKGKVYILSFAKSDLDNLVKEFLLSQTPEGKTINLESLKIDWTVDSVDLKKGKIVLNLNLSGTMYSIIDENSLRESLAGKSSEEIQIIFSSVSQIKNFQIKFHPFFLRKFPEEVDKIKLKIEN